MLPSFRAGDHVTFVYGNIVSQLVFSIYYFVLFFTIFVFDISFKLLLIYIDYVPGNEIPIPTV